MGAFERWSLEHLGQWHYVISYLYVLAAHNWPLLLACALGLWWGRRLYRRPGRDSACLFFSAVLLGVAYEYGKHAAPALRTSLPMVLNREAGWLGGPAHALVGGLELLLLGVAALFLLQGGWLALRDAATGRAPRHAAPAHPQETP